MIFNLHLPECVICSIKLVDPRCRSCFFSSHRFLPRTLLSIVSSLIYSKRRAVLELISPSLKKLWREWDLRVMVLLSLVLQIVLIIMGNRRKYSHKLWISLILWVAYLSADSVATLAFGVLSNNLADFYTENSGCNLDANAQLTSFWAPFLLLHLGGPDTITAYALGYNELWLRHFLGLIAQTTTTIYVLVMAWKGSRLSIMFILMFLARLIKYGERTLALRSATNERLRRELRELSPGDTKYSEQKFNMIAREKSDEGYFVGVDMTNISKEFPLHLSFSDNNSASDGDGDILRAAYELREATLSLFLDSTLTFQLRDRIHSGFRNMLPQQAFRVIEMELGLLYDRLYTKATLLYKPCIFILRLITFLLTCFVFLFLTFLQGKDEYSKIDICITFLLLAIAIFLDIYSALVLLSSDQFFAWLNFDKKISTLKFPICSQPCKSPRWSNTMCQMSFLSCSMKLESLQGTFPFWVEEKLDVKREYRWLAGPYEEIPQGFKIFIFEYFKGKAGLKTPTSTSRREAGDWMTDEAPKFEDDPAKAILFWHIVTQLSFFSDRDKPKNEIAAHCNRISRYMLYLLVKHPSMASVGITQIRFQKTVEIAADCINSSTEAEACEQILERSNRISDGLLADAISHTKRMQKEKKDLNEKWNTLGAIWFGMMGNAAKKCKGREHAQQLRRGGELLTHVWLLMAHFGLTDHFQITHNRPIETLIAK